MQITGISTLDEILHGGVPAGSSVVLLGKPGTGKTILALQWLFSGYHDSAEPGIYIGFTESNKRAMANAAQFQFYKESSVDPKKVHFTDLRLILNELGIGSNGSISIDEANEVIDVIRHMVDQMGAKRVVLDSLTAFLYLIEGSGEKRDFIFRLGTALSAIGATIFMTCEGDARQHSRFGVAEYIADGIIEMTNSLGQQSMIRRMNILKMRGSDFRTGPVVFDITKDGLLIYPKIPNYSTIAQTDFSSRKSLGVPEMDAMIGGGIPQGHILLCGGNTGSGKSTLAMHFVEEAVERANEACVYVALEESNTQLRKTAEQHGWDMEKWEKSGMLTFVTAELIDLNPDKLLYEMIKAVEKTGAKRVVIDSISSMENAAFDKTRIREFLLQIVAYFKSEGITCFMTYLTAEMFGASENQLMSGTASSELGLSSMVDGIILLRYVERNQEVKKLISVLKMRGSEHEKGIMEFEVRKDGFHLGERFMS